MRRPKNIILLHYMETVEVEYIAIQLRKKKKLTKKRKRLYGEVCNNKLLDCHHSDKDRIGFIRMCVKKDAK